jgi:hypothetical protein
MPPACSADELERLSTELSATVRNLPRSSGGDGGLNGWSDFSQALTDQLARRHPSAFLRYPVVRKTMFVVKDAYLRNELQHLRDSPLWAARWQPALRETRVGNPDPLWLYPWSSGNTVHHLYHICRLTEAVGANPEKIGYIFEFGGGYGNLCRLFHRIGFRGRYTIFDLPHFSALQNFYLRAAGASDLGGGLCLTTNEDEASRELQKMADGRSLLVATWSLSEAPLAARRLVADHLPRFDYILIAYRDTFGGVDNDAYFRQVGQRLSSTHDCVTEPIAHLPQNNYFFAARKSGHE